MSLGRLVIPLLTPFDNNLEIDYNSLAKHVDLLKYHVDNIFILGTSGEWPCLNINEKIRLVEYVSNIYNPDRLVVGVHSISLKDVYSMVRVCKDLSIKYIISLPPLYYKPTFRQFLRYYEEICKIFDNMILVYLYTNVQGYEVPVDWIFKLVYEYSNIVGFKITSRDFKYILNILYSLKDVGRSVVVYIGNGYLALPFIEAGGYGVVDILLNIIPKIFRDIIHGNVGLYRELLNIYNKLSGINLIRFCKSILKFLNIYSSDNTRFISETVSEQLVKHVVNAYSRFLLV